MANNESVKRKDKEKLKTKCREDVQLPAKVSTNRPAISGIPEEIDSIWYGHLRRINVSKRRIDLLNDEYRPYTTLRSGQDR